MGREDERVGKESFDKVIDDLTKWAFDARDAWREKHFAEACHCLDQAAQCMLVAARLVWGKKK